MLKSNRKIVGEIECIRHFRAGDTLLCGGICLMLFGYLLMSLASTNQGPGVHITSPSCDNKNV